MLRRHAILLVEDDSIGIAIEEHIGDDRLGGETLDERDVSSLVAAESVATLRCHTADAL